MLQGLEGSSDNDQIEGEFITGSEMFNGMRGCKLKNLRTPKHSVVKIRQPITIFTDGHTIEAESRSLIDTGVFIHCNEKLQKDKTYRMLIKLPQEKSVEVKGKLMWSNTDGVHSQRSFSDSGTSFVEIANQDRQFLNEAVSYFILSTIITT